MIRKSLLILLINLLAVYSFAQKAEDVLGKWKTIDDETGKEKSIVELYMQDGKMFGKVVKILNPDKVDAKCVDCEGALKDKPIFGMIIVNNMEWDEDEWDDGTILDPNKGSVYDCKIWLEEDDPNTLYVRGYIGFLFRTQNWLRVP